VGLDQQRRFLSEKRWLMTSEELRAELRIELAPIRALLEGVPLIGRSVMVLQQDARALRAAFDNFALTQTTAGEIQRAIAIADVHRVQVENAELAARVATLERLVSELQK
jgi:hypothetical protein